MKILFLLILAFIAFELSAQNYTRDVGFRVGDFFSAGYRQFLEDDNALEGIISGGRKGAKLTVLKEHSIPALGRISENLHFTYGYGAHAGFRYMDRYKVLNRTYALDEYRFMPLIGLDGLIAVEYRFAELPFIMSFDLMPYFEYSSIQIFNLYLNNLGFSIKYRF
jgi:hypothetical protein